MHPQLIVTAWTLAAAQAGAETAQAHVAGGSTAVGTRVTGSTLANPPKQATGAAAVH